MCSHKQCLAKNFLTQEGATSMLLPVQGDCIRCDKSLLWGDVIRQQLGCYKDAVDQVFGNCFLFYAGIVSH